MESISVVMITCEGSQWVEAQARSIAAQTRLPDEVLIADDASDDDTIEIATDALKSLANRCRVMRSEQRLGVTANLERAVRVASGDVVVFADQDDVWLPHKLAAVEQWASSSGSGGMFSDGWVIDAGGHRTNERLWARAGFTRHQVAGWHNDALAVLLKRPVVTGATLAVRRATLDLLLPLPEHGWHDYAMSLLLAASSGISSWSDPLIEYRLHGSNAAGLPATSRRKRVQNRDAHRDNLRTQILLFETLIDRLAAHGDEGAVGRLVAKAGVLRRRAALPSARPLRMAGVLGLTVGGGYHRYAQGWASAARDLLWP